MHGEMKRSPALAAPGFNNCVGNRSTGHIDGALTNKRQALSDEQLDLVNNYLPLAWSLIKGYRNRGRTLEELRAGAEDGLLGAALNFDPSLGFPFAAYAHPWINGGIKAIFKSRKIDKFTHSVETIEETEEAPVTLPAVDLGSLEDRERQIIDGRVEGESLKEIGKELGIRAERVRQIEVSRNGETAH